VTVVGVIRPVSAPVSGSDAPLEPAPPGDWHWKAWRVLARFGPRTVPALIEALSTGDDPAVRQFAADSLGRLGREALGAEETLRRVAQHDGSPMVRMAAIAALEAIREDVEKSRSG
jgi:hypothetical protein